MLKQDRLTIASVRSNFNCFIETQEQFGLAGRIIGVRNHKKIVFFDLHDFTGCIQVLVEKTGFSDADLRVCELIKLGDIISLAGCAILAHSGEPTVNVESINILNLAEVPLPNCPREINKQPIRTYHRCVEMNFNQRLKKILMSRSLVLKSIRRTLENNGYWEVDTPILNSESGSPMSRPFVVNVNALDQDFYLRKTSEIYLKQAIIGGFERVFEVSKQFRNEGISAIHSPEFLQCEIYAAYTSYHEMKKLAHQLLIEIANILKSHSLIEDSVCESLTSKLEIHSFIQLVQDRAEIPEEHLFDSCYLKEYLVKSGYDLSNNRYGNDSGSMLMMIFKKYVQPTIQNLSVVFNGPSSINPLTVRSPEDDRLVEDFRLIWKGIEFSHGSNELFDSRLQRDYLEHQLSTSQAFSNQDFDRKKNSSFLDALKIGLPPTSGLAFGIERFCMLLTESTSLAETMFFHPFKD
jgi:lysyl-tRNA synthetase, class II